MMNIVASFRSFGDQLHHLSEKTQKQDQQFPPHRLEMRIVFFASWSILAPQLPFFSTFKITLCIVVCVWRGCSAIHRILATCKHSMNSERFNTTVVNSSSFAQVRFLPPSTILFIFHYLFTLADGSDLACPIGVPNGIWFRYDITSSFCSWQL